MACEIWTFPGFFFGKIWTFSHFSPPETVGFSAEVFRQRVIVDQKYVSSWWAGQLGYGAHSHGQCRSGDAGDGLTRILQLIQTHPGYKHMFLGGKSWANNFEDTHDSGDRLLTIWGGYSCNTNSQKVTGQIKPCLSLERQIVNWLLIMRARGQCLHLTFFPGFPLIPGVTFSSCALLGPGDLFSSRPSQLCHIWRLSQLSRSNPDI